jgi:hypothetical protein
MTMRSLAFFIACSVALHREATNVDRKSIHSIDEA